MLMFLTKTMHWSLINDMMSVDVGFSNCFNNLQLKGHTEITG